MIRIAELINAINENIENNDIESAIYYIDKFRVLYSNKLFLINNQIKIIENHIHPNNIFHKIEKISWTAIITLYKRKDYLREQILSIRNQSINPKDIIIIINDNHIDRSIIKDIDLHNLYIINSDINSLYTRWIIGYNSCSEYICVFDDDVIPGKHWIANALRCSRKFNALVGPTGRIFDKNGRHNFFVDVHSESIQNNDKKCDWVCNSYLFKRDWIKYIIDKPRYNNFYKTYDDIQLATSLKMVGGIDCYVPFQPDSDKSLSGNLKNEYGADQHAIWRTHNHNGLRRDYTYYQISKGFNPILYNNKNKHYQLSPNKKVNIIVPIYNRSNIVDKCLSSILSQTYNNIEIIIYDDGSKDNSIDIVKNMLDGNKHIILSCQTNNGPGYARNRAVEIATGEYITFLDSDDYYFDNEYIENCIKFMEQLNIDCLINPYTRSLGQQQTKDKIKLLSGPLENAHIKYLNREFGTHAPGAKFYERNLIKNIYFSEYGYSEDVSFCYKTIKRAKNPFYTNFYGYMHVKDYTSCWNPDQIQVLHIYSSLRLLMEITIIELNDKISLDNFISLWIKDHLPRINTYISKHGINDIFPLISIAQDQLDTFTSEFIYLRQYRQDIKIHETNYLLPESYYKHLINLKTKIEDLKAKNSF